MVTDKAGGYKSSEATKERKINLFTETIKLSGLTQLVRIMFTLKDRRHSSANCNQTIRERNGPSWQALDDCLAECSFDNGRKFQGCSTKDTVKALAEN